MFKIAILGGSGYVGSRIVAAFQRSNFECTVARRSHVAYYDVSALSQWMVREHISFLVNAAGFTGRPNVDACEIQKTECLLGNSVLPGRIREACEGVGIPFAHLSSGCIYTGQRSDGGGFTESDEPNFSFRTNNCSFYSGSKALGEEILQGCEQCYIWRLRIPFNHEPGPRNYLSKLLNYAKLLDARNSLSHLDDFAQACVDCVIKRVPFGTYNLTNTGSVTTREVVAMLRSSIASDRHFEFFVDEDEFMREAAIAPRSNCVLDNGKAIRAGIRIRSVQEAIEDAIVQWGQVPSPPHVNAHS